MRFLGFLSLLSISVSALASPTRRTPHVLHEKRHVDAGDWERLHRLDKELVLPLRIGLTQGNIDRLEEFLMSVSHPESPSYGKHWSAAQVVETFAPTQETIGAVRDWLINSGFDASRFRLTPNKGWIEMNATVAEAEELLDTEYHMFGHSSGKKHAACHSYSVPQHVRRHIDIITPTVHFDARITQPLKMKRDIPNVPQPDVVKSVGSPSSGNVPASGKLQGVIDQLKNCDQLITPDCIRALYEVVYTPIATKKNSYGIVEYTPQAFLQSDLNMFFTNFSTHQVGDSPNPIVLVDGAVVQDIATGFNFNGESDLDLQYGMSLTFPQPVTLYQVGDLEEGASFNNFLDAIDGTFCTFEGGDNPEFDATYPDPLAGGFQGQSCGIAKPANVISSSYGMNEADITPAYAFRQCNEYGKLGLMGTTILYSSGDDGVAGFGNACLNPDGTQSRNGTIFNPSFPGGCPFVTSVGATQVNPNSTVFEPEGACEQVIFSGGGFSNFFARPSFQDTAVKNFLKEHPPPFTSGQFNTSTSRAFPDLSANGANYVVAVAGEFLRVFGTSASSPVVGSILTLINDARLALGKSPIGFINPTIYSPAFQKAFNDITQGGNQGCGTAGFTSAPGWDPVTGLGTPNFPKLLALWLLLP